MTVWIDAYRTADAWVADGEYFVYGEAQDPVSVGPEYVPHALKISRTPEATEPVNSRANTRQQPTRACAERDSLLHHFIEARSARTPAVVTSPYLDHRMRSRCSPGFGFRFVQRALRLFVQAHDYV